MWVTYFEPNDPYNYLQHKDNVLDLFGNPIL